MQSDIFKNTSNIDKDILEKFIVKGGKEEIKKALHSWGHDKDERIAIPTIHIARDGNIGGVKWTILGNTLKKVTIKATNLWPDCEENVSLSLTVPELDCFTFDHQSKNISEWVDCSELSWTVKRKGERHKDVTEDYNMTDKSFSIRLCICIACFCYRCQPHTCCLAPG